MEIELDPSAVGQSFEKVGQTISEAQMEGLQTVGPLDQNGKLAPEKWLRNDSTQPPAGASSTSWLLSSKLCFWCREIAQKRCFERGCHSRGGVLHCTECAFCGNAVVENTGPICMRFVFTEDNERRENSALFIVIGLSLIHI